MKYVLRVLVLYAFLIGSIIAQWPNIYTSLCNNIESLNEETDQKLRDAESAIAKLRAECICAFNKDVYAMLKVIQKKIDNLRNGCYCPPPTTTTRRTPVPRPSPTWTLRDTKTCPEGWSLFQGICYSFHNETRNWDSAQEKCGNLASGDTEEVNNFLRDLANRMRRYRSGPWIGGKRIEGTWVWTKNRQPLTFEDWRTGHPEFKDDECIRYYLYEETSMKWNNQGCNDYAYHFICEKPQSA